jgi:hypothetical protein
MITIKIYDQLITHQLGNTTRVLPLNANAYIGLFHFPERVVHYDVDLLTEGELHKLFQLGQLLFCDLSDVFSQLKTVLAEISIEMAGLIITPFKILMLYAVLSKFHAIRLRHEEKRAK